MKRVAAAFVTFCLVTGRLSAQAMSAQEIHDRVAQVIAEVSGGHLPAGDTSVSWRPDSPILYHTAQQMGAVIRTGMARNDGLVGTLESQWGPTEVTGFTSRWSRGDSIEVAWTGTVTTDGIRVQGPRGDSLLARPQMRWLVADYGMEDQFMPLFATLHVSDSVRVAVLRPYQLKWDTVTVIVSGPAEAKRVLLKQGPPAPLELLLAPDATILRIGRGTEFERRPLETSARYRQYQALCRPRSEGGALTSACS